MLSTSTKFLLCVKALVDIISITLIISTTALFINTNFKLAGILFIGWVIASKIADILAPIVMEVHRKDLGLP
jgi:hypothetical protein